ncbi:MAG: acetoin utilization protein AcuB [Flavobacteriales bacterium]|jgi:acetoin utilization protein AcuB
MSLEKIMSTPVVSVEMDSSLAEIKRIFEDTGFHHLVVVEDNRLVGIISDRDLLKALSPKLGTAAACDSDLATLNKKAHQVMTRKPICIHRETIVLKAIEVFKKYKISCIPVVDDRQYPVGIVSWRDIFMAITT